MSRHIESMRCQLCDCGAYVVLGQESEHVCRTEEPKVESFPCTWCGRWTIAGARHTCPPGTFENLKPAEPLVRIDHAEPCITVTVDVAGVLGKFLGACDPSEAIDMVARLVAALGVTDQVAHLPADDREPQGDSIDWDRKARS